MQASRTGSPLVATVGIAIALAVGFGVHFSAKKRGEQRAIVTVVGDTTEQLRTTLKTASPKGLDKVEGNLKIAKGWSRPELVDAAEQYLIGAREILKRRAEANRLAQKAAASRAALSAHMTRAGQRDTDWIRTASSLKKQVERDHFDLDVQLKALADLLDDLPQANKRLSPHVEASLLLEDDVRKAARQDVLAEAKRASAELEKVRSILPR